MNIVCLILRRVQNILKTGHEPDDMAALFTDKSGVNRCRIIANVGVASDTCHVNGVRNVNKILKLYTVHTNVKLSMLRQVRAVTSNNLTFGNSVVVDLVITVH